ncbi:hypothetical protein QWY84_15400 [Aquisalimonas lutea]|uniref:hypothetical protein n=1 Tax=Aquisalimonas lutea TaxID=1327750 RepID=UPI0025B2E433|nr:hypothetical protein [Aquisalimonas lutea]MDN3519003.1 hypothetical protein [Aquisalimonas lutea]
MDLEAISSTPVRELVHYEGPVYGGLRDPSVLVYITTDGLVIPVSADVVDVAASGSVADPVWSHIEWLTEVVTLTSCSLTGDGSAA